MIDPFGAGGTTCCAVLPRTWHPGIKLQVRTTFWTENRSTGNISEFKDVRIVEVPRYVDGKPGALWVVRQAGGGVNVIATDFQPDHPKWPGKVKGWPVPSLEYRLERWKLYRDLEQDRVDLGRKFLNELKKSPLGEAKAAWEYSKQDNPSSLAGFTGPEDPKYIGFLEREYRGSLEMSRRRLQEIMEARP